MQELVGKIVNAIFMADGEDLIIFDTNVDQVAYYTYGDCCSETWFADIVGVKSLLGLTVRKVERIELSEEFAKYMDVAPVDRSRQQADDYYGWRVFTDLGSCDFIYRNSSNGYYGGDIEYNSGAIYDLHSPDSTFKKIVEDWRA